MPRHRLTPEERRRGQKKGAETKRLRKEEAQQLAIEHLAGMTLKAVERLEELLASEDEAIARRGIRDVLEYILGRPVQPIQHGGLPDGPIEIRLAFDPRPDGD